MGERRERNNVFPTCSVKRTWTIIFHVIFLWQNTNAFLESSNPIIACSSSCEANDLMALRGLSFFVRIALLMNVFFTHDTARIVARQSVFRFFFSHGKKTGSSIMNGILFVKVSYIVVEHPQNGTSKFSDFRQMGEKCSFPSTDWKEK